jgi:hypothetical protein
MNHVWPRATCGLAALIGLSALGCSEGANPMAPELRSDLSNVSASAFSRASGHKVRIKYVVGNNVVDNYEFEAEEFDDGSVKGTFRVREKRFDPADPSGTKVIVKFKGDVVCVAVDGKKARIGGVVTKSNFKEGIPVGSLVTWSVSDNGKGRRDDSASPLLGSADAKAYCALGLAYPEHQVGRGQVKVDPDD